MATIEQSRSSTRSAAKAFNSMSVGEERSISLTDSERFLSAFYETPPGRSGRSKKQTRRFWPRVFAITALMLVFYLWVGEGSAMHRSVVDFIKKGPHHAVVAQIFNFLSDDKSGAEKTLEDEMLAEASDRLWKEPLDPEKAAGFRNVLDSLRRRCRHDADCRSSLSLLNWMVDVRRYFAGKPPDKPIALFEDDDRIIELLETWRQSKTSIQALLNRLETLSDGAFSQYRVYSQVHRLIDIELLYVRAIKVLKTQLQEKIDNGKHTEIEPLIAAFKRRFPGVQGVAALESDLADYSARYSAYQAGKPSDFCQNADFRTPIFSEARRSLCRETVPPSKKQMVAGNKGKSRIAISDLILDPGDGRP